MRRLAVVAAYVVVVAVMTIPYVNWTELSRASYAGDARLIIWTLAWDNHAVLDGRPLFDSNIFYPALHSLAYNEHLFGLSLFTLPIYAASRNPVLAYNIVWLLSFVLNGVTTHAWLRRHTADDLAAAAGSLVFTFSFYKMLHAHGHLHLVWTWLLPLTAIALERWTERPRIGRALLWAGAVLLQALTSWYLAVLVCVLQAALLCGELPSLWRAGQLRRVWQLALATVLALAIVWPFARMYRTLAPASAAEMTEYSVGIVDYLTPPENTWLGQAWLAHVGRGPRWIWGEQTVYVGWIAVMLAAIGLRELVSRRAWRTIAVFGGLTVLSVALSAGPAGPWAPFSWVARVPGLQSFRVPARFALLVIFGLSLLVTAGADRLARAGRVGRTSLLLLMPLMLSEWFVIKFPGQQPLALETPAIYRASALDQTRGLVVLPQYRGRPDWPLGADYLLFSTERWVPIVNGFGRAEPPEHAHVASHMNAFPGPNNARTMRALQIDHVIVHAARYPDGARTLLEDALKSPEYRLIVQLGTDYLFEVTNR